MYDEIDDTYIGDIRDNSIFKIEDKINTLLNVRRDTIFDIQRSSLYGDRGHINKVMNLEQRLEKINGDIRYLSIVKNQRMHDEDRRIDNRLNEKKMSEERAMRDSIDNDWRWKNDDLKQEMEKLKKQVDIDNEIGRQRSAGPNEMYKSSPKVIYLRKKKSAKSKPMRKPVKKCRCK